MSDRALSIHVLTGGSARRAWCNHHCAPDNDDYIEADHDALMRGDGDERVGGATCMDCLEQIARWRDWVATA